MKSSPYRDSPYQQNSALGYNKYDSYQGTPNVYYDKRKQKQNQFYDFYNDNNDNNFLNPMIEQSYNSNNYKSPGYGKNNYKNNEQNFFESVKPITHQKKQSPQAAFVEKVLEKGAQQLLKQAKTYKNSNPFLSNEQSPQSSKFTTPSGISPSSNYSNNKKFDFGNPKSKSPLKNNFLKTQSTYQSPIQTPKQEFVYSTPQKKFNMQKNQSVSDSSQFTKVYNKNQSIEDKMKNNALDNQYNDYIRIKSRRKSSFLDNMIMTGVHHLMDKTFNRKYDKTADKGLQEKIKRKFQPKKTVIEENQENTTQNLKKSVKYNIEVLKPTEYAEPYTFDEKKKQKLNKSIMKDSKVKPIFEDNYKISVKQYPNFTVKNKKNLNIVMPYEYEKSNMIEIQSPLQPQQTCRKELMKYIDKMSRQGCKYDDFEFPPNLSALTNRPREEAKKTQSRYKDMDKWERIKQIYNDKYLFVTKYIDPNDIKQGELRSHNVISVLSVLAQNPKNIQRIVEDQKVNSAGIYYARICKDGIWRYIVMDDYFPYSGQNELIFTSQKCDDNSIQTNEVEFWAPLIEKALAKCYGTYQDMEITHVPIKEILKELTGCPTDIIKLDEFQGDIGSLITSSIEKGYIVMATNEDSEDKQLLCANQGIPPNYSFGVVDVKGKIIQFSNPWGWVQEFEQDIQKNFETGQFKMNQNQIKKYFDKIVITQNISDNYYVAKQTRHRKNAYTILEFEKKVPGQCTIEATQLDKRNFRTHIKKKHTRAKTDITQSVYSEKSAKSIMSSIYEENYDYVMGRIILCEKTDGQKINPYNVKTSWERDWNYIQGASGKQKTISMEVNLNPGRYCLLLLMDWQNDTHYDVNVSYFGREKIHFSRIDYKLASNVISNAFISESIVHGFVNKNQNQVFEYIYLSENERLLVLTFQNRGQETVEFTKNFSGLNKNKLELVNYLDDQILNSSKFMNTQEMHLCKSDYKFAKIKLEQFQFKALTFKVTDPEIKFAPKLIKELGLR